MKKKAVWEQHASKPSEYHAVEAKRGREFIVRLTTGADPLKALRQFAIDKEIRFGKVHAAFMGGLQPAMYDQWAPDARDMSNWSFETTAVKENLTMLLSASGMIGIRRDADGKEETFVAMHFVSGGAWDSATFGGHMDEGTRVKGVMQIFVTELLGIDVLYPSHVKDGDPYPENWYQKVK